VTIQHQSLAAGRWQTFSFVEQMAHIGGEVERAMNWREKQNPDYSRRAFERALELLSLSLDDPRNVGRARELARVYEALVDYFAGSNEYGSSDRLWRGYFLPFAYAARRNR
jgi:hypothetical protein